MKRLTTGVAVLSAMFALGARTARADTIQLTGGFINYYVGELGGASLSGPGFQVGGTTFGTGRRAFDAGTMVDFSGSYGFGGCGTAVINGTRFQSSSDFNSGCGSQVWITAALNISASQFIVPSIADMAGFFRTPFTLTGNILGSVSPGGPVLFSADVTGSGMAYAGYRLISGPPSTFLTDGPSFVLSAPSPAPTPEPATLTLFGGALGLAGLVVLRGRKLRAEAPGRP